MFGLSSWEPATARVKASRESSKYPIGAGATHGGGAPRPRYEYVVDVSPSGVDAPFTTTMVTPLFIDHWRTLAVGDVVTVLHKPGTEKVKWDRSEPSTSERAARKAAEEARRQSANQDFDAALQAGPGNSPNRRATSPGEVAEALEAARRARGAEIGAPGTPWSPAVGFDPDGGPMFGKHWVSAVGNVMAVQVVKTTGDGLVSISEFVVDVRTPEGEIFRAKVEEPRIATDWKQPSIGDAVRVEYEPNSRKVRFDKDDPNMSWKAYKQGRTDAFENTLHQAPGTPVGVSAGMPGAEDPRIAQLLAMAKANGGAIRLDSSNPETAALREMLLKVAKQAQPEDRPGE